MRLVHIYFLIREYVYIQSVEKSMYLYILECILNYILCIYSVDVCMNTLPDSKTEYVCIPL